MYRVFDTGLVGMQHFFPVGIRYPLRLVRFSIKIHHHGMAQGLDFARFSIFQALLHLEAGVAYLEDATFTNNGVVEQHGMAEVQVHMDEDIFKGQPVNFGLEDMLKVSASTHVEKVALRPVVDMVIRVEVAHADLYGTREHKLLISSQNAVSAAV